MYINKSVLNLKKHEKVDKSSEKSRFKSLINTVCLCIGNVAYKLEHSIDNREDGGSTPPGHCLKLGIFFLLNRPIYQKSWIFHKCLQRIGENNS